jgi:hypothetical protein
LRGFLTTLDEVTESFKAGKDQKAAETQPREQVEMEPEAAGRPSEVTQYGRQRQLTSPIIAISGRDGRTGRSITVREALKHVGSTVVMSVRVQQPCNERPEVIGAAEAVTRGRRKPAPQSLRVPASIKDVWYSPVHNS